jgi:hypothetical protein
MQLGLEYGRQFRNRQRELWQCDFKFKFKFEWGLERREFGRVRRRRQHQLKLGQLRQQLRRGGRQGLWRGLRHG